MKPLPAVWQGFTKTESEVYLRLGRMVGVFDKSAPAVKVLRKKLDAVKRAPRYLEEKRMGRRVSGLVEPDVMPPAGKSR